MNDRLARLRQEISRAGLGAMAVVPGSTMRYLTRHGFEVTDRLFLLLVPAEGTPAVALPNFDESNWRDGVAFETQVFGWDDTEGPANAVERAFDAAGQPKKVGVESLAMRVMEYEHMRGVATDCEIVSADAVTSSLRLHKDVDEIAAIRSAVQIAEASLAEILGDIRVGVTEQEIASRLVQRLLANGGESVSFGPIVLSGPRSALPHGIPEDRRIKSGEFLLIDFGTTSGGYHSDITRTFVVGGEPDDAMREVYEAVRSGNERGREACRPGATAHDVHHAAQGHFRDDAFANFLTHRTGHGLGLEIHESPSIMEGNDERLEPGTVFTVEPGLYKEGWGGVRIEDDVVITSNGSESLTTFPRDLQVLGV